MNQHHKNAADHFAAERESFERCDTDGCYSQFASNLMGRLEQAKARLEDAGRVAEFDGLYQGDRRVKAKEGHGQFGSYWMLHEDEAELIAARGKRFLPTGKRSRILKQLGLTERTEVAPAWACHSGGGNGFAGMLTVRVVTFRTGDKWGQDAKLK